MGIFLGVLLIVLGTMCLALDVLRYFAETFETGGTYAPSGTRLFAALGLVAIAIGVRTIWWF